MIISFGYILYRVCLSLYCGYFNLFVCMCWFLFVGDLVIRICTCIYCVFHCFYCVFGIVLFMNIFFLFVFSVII